MQELEVTWGRTLRIYWALVWRGTLLCGLAGFVVGFLFGFAFALAGRNDLIETWWFAYLATPLWIFIAIWLLRYVMRKKTFADFRIALVPAEPPPPASSV